MAKKTTRKTARNHSTKEVRLLKKYAALKKEHQARQKELQVPSSKRLNVFLVILILNVVAVLAYRAGAEKVLPLLIANTVLLVVGGLWAMPGIMLMVFGSLFIVLLILVPLLGLLVYGITQTPALNDSRAVAVTIFIIGLILLIVFCTALYLRVEKYLFDKLRSS